ncbi:MAG: hypothetical protein ACE10D_11075 [Planctomycetota bacterium]
MRIPVLLALLCAPLAQGAKTRVAVLGAIHGSHLGSKGYSVEAVIETVRNFKPDVVCVEIPPDLFAGHVKAIDRKGFGTTKSDLQGQRWIGAFPELYRGVIPLRKELGFEVVPVSGGGRHQPGSLAQHRGRARTPPRQAHPDRVWRRPPLLVPARAA